MGQRQIMNITMDDGSPDGTLKVDLVTWDCAMYRIERSKLQNYASDPGLKACGIYFLIGKKDGQPAVYVGQANSRENGNGILGRVIEHDRPAESYWNLALLIYSNSGALYATELNYLERCLWEQMQKGPYHVVNVSKPPLGNCSDTTQVTMDRFIEGIKIMVGIFGYTFLESSSEKAPVLSKSKTTPIPTVKQFTIKRASKIPGRNINATLEVRNSQFVVLKGSLIATVPRDAKRSNNYHHDKYSTLIDAVGKLTQDIAFDKVSASSAFVVYGSSNGNIDWKDEEGKPIKDFIS